MLRCSYSLSLLPSLFLSLFLVCRTGAGECPCQPTVKLVLCSCVHGHCSGSVFTRFDKEKQHAKLVIINSWHAGHNPGSRSRDLVEICSVMEGDAFEAEEGDRLGLIVSK